MSTILDTAKREFNPVHDMDGIHYRNHFAKEKLSDIWAAQRHNVKTFFIPIPKHIGRGMLVGGLAGAFASVMAGGTASDGFREGSFLGLILDTQQYKYRSVWRYMTRQMEPD